MDFSHVRIDDAPPCGRLGFCQTADLTGNGLPDIIVGGMGREGVTTVAGKRLVLSRMPLIGDLIRRREYNVFWYENPGWERHDVVQQTDLCVGATMADIDSDGTPELIVGENNGTGLYWFDPAPDPRDPWTTHLITDTFTKYHDTAVGDVDGDGDDELVILSQESKIIGYYDIPADPTVSPWPENNQHIIATDLLVEGVAIADIDHDGSPELIAGANVFSKNGSSWRQQAIAEDWLWTRIVVHDIDGDGRDEIIMSEGDLPYQGDRLGRVGIVDTQTWDIDLLEEELHCPHSVAVADVTGSGSPDLLIGEMGLGSHHTPRLFLYANDGSGHFTRHTIQEGIPTHEAAFVDLTGDGRPDIVGKPYGPDRHVDIWFNQIDAQPKMPVQSGGTGA